MFEKKSQQPSDIQFFVIYDSKSQSYGPPLPSTNKFTIIREFENTFRDPQQSQNQYLLNAEDYSIFKIADYYKKDASLLTHQLEHVMNLHDIRTQIQAKGIVST